VRHLGTHALAPFSFAFVIRCERESRSIDALPSFASHVGAELERLRAGTEL